MRNFFSMALLFGALVLSGCNVRLNRVHPKWNQDAVWEKTPISVEWTEIDRAYDSVFTRAIDSWNHAVGCRVLVKASDPASADVKIAPYEGAGCGLFGTSDIDTTPNAVAGTWRCTAASAEIRFRQMSGLEGAYVSALHEMGHLLGLAHDDSELMSPSPPVCDEAAFNARCGGLLLYPAEADASLIAARYCHK